MKTINIMLENKEHKFLKKLKGELTWEQVLKKGIYHIGTSKK